MTRHGRAVVAAAAAAAVAVAVAVAVAEVKAAAAVALDQLVLSRQSRPLPTHLEGKVLAHFRVRIEHCRLCQPQR